MSDGANPLQIELTDGRGHLFIEVVSSRLDYESWAITHIRAELPGFQAAFNNELILGELQGFHSDLQRLYAELKGTAQLNAIEGFLDVTAEMDTQGHIHWEVELAHTGSGTWGRLKFEMDNDQSYLPALLDQFETVFKNYPSNGPK